MKDWIAARRAEITKQKDDAMSIFNQTAGALKLLDLIEAEISKPATPPDEPASKEEV